jgi:uncharacterized damage-inducible protein DinB
VQRVPEGHNEGKPHPNHRGQSTVYLRPLGASVPAIYGPSADEQG